MKITLLFDYDYKRTGAISIRVIESNDIKFEFYKKQLSSDFEYWFLFLDIIFDKTKITLKVLRQPLDDLDAENVKKEITNKLLRGEDIKLIIDNYRGTETIFKVL